MILIRTLLLIFHFFSFNDTSDFTPVVETEITYSEIQIKSVISEDNNQVFIDIKLPEGSEVGFEIYNESGKILHLWNDQELNPGSHQLALTLPSLEKGKYLLHIKVGTSVYKHLVLLP